ncbi:MAG: S8 family peptidase [Caldilineaceae bacterium]
MIHPNQAHGRPSRTEKNSAFPWQRILGLAAVFLVLWLAALAAVQGGQSATPAIGPTPDPRLAHSGLLLVGLDPTISPAAADQIFASQGLIPADHWPEFGLASVSLSAAENGQNREKALATAAVRLGQQPGIRYVENDWAIESASLGSPNDPYFPDQWALARINMPAAWEATAGDPSMVIALVDSGLDLTHEDLKDLPLWVNEAEVNGIPGQDDDSNGYVDDFNGWDWVGSDNQFEDPYGHGTHVGGILAAATDNGIGVASVGRSLPLMPLRVLDERGSGFISYLVDALSYARRKGARIINLSLVLRIDSLAVADSVRAYAEAGGLIVAATGNYGNQVYWPAAYSQTLAVAATTRDDTRAYFSNRGPETDLAAPGEMVLSTYLNNGYYLNDGTSMAVPHVSALAGLVWSLRPDWDWQQVKAHLKATAVDVNAPLLPGPDNDIGAGRIDAAAALAQAGAGVSFTVDYLAGQYTRVDQLLRIPVQVAVSDTATHTLPIVGVQIHYALYQSPEIGSGENGPGPVLSGTVASSATGRGLFEIPMPAHVGHYELRIRMAGHENIYPVTLQDGPLVLAAEAVQPVLAAGNEQTPLQFSARGGGGKLLEEPLWVELATNLGHFSDGSRQRGLWMENGTLTEVLAGGQEAGVAEIVMNAAGQTQRAFVSIQPGPTQQISGPKQLMVQDWGQGSTVPIGLELRDQFGNPIWDAARVNFYTLAGTFAPQSPGVKGGRVETQLFLPAWAPPRINYWAVVPGTFALFRGEVVILRNHYWLPRIDGEGQEEDVGE